MALTAVKAIVIVIVMKMKEEMHALYYAFYPAFFSPLAFYISTDLFYVFK